MIRLFSSLIPRSSGIIRYVILGALIAFFVGGIFAYVSPALQADVKIFAAWAFFSLLLCAAFGFLWEYALGKRLKHMAFILQNADTVQEFAALRGLLRGLPFNSQFADLWNMTGTRLTKADALVNELRAQLAQAQADYAQRRNAIVHYHDAFDSFFNHSSTPMFQSTADGRLIKSNEALAALLGYQSPEQLHEEIWNVVKALYIDENERQEFLDALRKEHVVHKEIRLRTRDGEAVPVHISGWALKDEHGHNIGQQGAIMDLRLKYELADVKEKLHRAYTKDIAKTRFLASVSHKLRTPLNSLIDMTKLLQAAPTGSDVGEYAMRLQKSWQDAVGVANEIFDLSKLELGNFTLELAPFSLKDLIDGIYSKIRPLAEARGLTLNGAVTGKLPQYFIGDKSRLEQVWLNLLDNAVKYTPSGTVEFTVEPAQAQPLEIGKDALLFQVRDSGPGMAPEVLELAFNEFYRGPNATEAGYEGPGLGLPLARELVGLMGGTLSLKSAPGEGTVASFTIIMRHQQDAHPLTLENYLTQKPAYILESLIKETQTISESIKGNIVYPVHAAQPEGPNALDLILLEDDSRLPVKKEQDKSGMRILLVEDNPNSRLLFSLLTRDTPHQVTEAANGEEAVKLFLHNRFDIVFMDIEMPLMDGLQATRLIRAAEQSDGRPRTPIVALTGYAAPGAKEQCLEAGCDIYLQKPYNLPVILDLLEEYSPDARLQ